MKNNEITSITYEVTEGMLQDTALRASSIEFVSPEGYKNGVGMIAHCRYFRVSVEKRRKELVGPSVAHQKKVNLLAKRLTSILHKIENPLKEKKQVIDSQKREERRRKDGAEVIRIAAIKESINNILSTPFAVEPGVPSVNIFSLVDKISRIKIDDFYAEFSGEAEAAKKQSLERLRKMQVSAEKIEFERREIALADARLKQITSEQLAEKNLLDARQARMDCAADEAAELVKKAAELVEEKLSERLEFSKVAEAQATEQSRLALVATKQAARQAEIIRLAAEQATKLCSQESKPDQEKKTQAISTTNKEKPNDFPARKEEESKPDQERGEMSSLGERVRGGRVLPAIKCGDTHTECPDNKRLEKFRTGAAGILMESLGVITDFLDKEPFFIDHNMTAKREFIEARLRNSQHAMRIDLAAINNPMDKERGL